MDTFYISSAFLTILSYFILLLQLRIFEVTAMMINVIFYAIKESLSFVLIFLLMTFGIGNSLYILSMLQYPDSSAERFSGTNIFGSFMFVYTGALGEQYNDDYKALKNYGPLFNAFQVCQTLVSNILLVNLLVSILGDIYDQVTSVQVSERFRAKCKLMNENEFIFPRERLFKKAKYIVRVEVEKIDSNGSSQSDWQGMVNTITTSFKTNLE